MKHLLRFNEELTNFSKVRKWPTYENGHTDYYFVYELNKNELGKYLNVWFQGRLVDRIEPKNRKRPQDKHVFYDEVITLKKCDDETSDMLYHKKCNPVSILIMNSYRGELFDMKAQIHSIDDSSFRIWWNNKSIEDLKECRKRLMEWTNTSTLSLHGLNGEDFLEICVSLGADPDKKDYN